MTLTATHVQEVSEVLQKAIHLLSGASVPTVHVTEFQKRTRKWLIPRRARFTKVAGAWPLGVLLLTDTGELFEVGETTRAVPPGYPGHTSNERERRREFTRTAFESGFPEGSILFYHSSEIELHEGSELTDSRALRLVDGQLRVRWNRSLPIETGIPFADYVIEQVELQISKHNSQ